MTILDIILIVLFAIFIFASYMVHRRDKKNWEADTAAYANMCDEYVRKFKQHSTGFTAEDAGKVNDELGKVLDAFQFTGIECETQGASFKLDSLIQVGLEVGPSKFYIRRK